jgi:hypothetical protein
LPISSQSKTKMKTKKTTKKFFCISKSKRHTAFFYREVHDAISLVSLVAITAVSIYFFLPQVRAAGLDSVTVSLSNETINADARVTVSFEVAGLSDGKDIKIYLGDNTGGDPWQRDGITTAHISCSDDGAGETYTPVAVNTATADTPMYAEWTATTVGAGATTVTCRIGNDGLNNPDNPASANGYSVAVITTDDSGAGIAYVGHSNDVNVAVAVLPNLSLTIGNADGTSCTTTGGITSCNLGTAQTTTVASGSYDVMVGTNAANGATISIEADGALRNGVDEIAGYVEDSGPITAGTNEYGMDLSADPTWNLLGDYADNASPIPTSFMNLATTAGAINIGGDNITVTHKAAIDSTVKALNYSQIVYWTAAANF